MFETKNYSLLYFEVQFCKINNTVYEHYHWMIYKMLFRDELKPNLNSKSNSIEVCNTCLFIYATDTLSSGK